MLYLHNLLVTNEGCLILADFLKKNIDKFEIIQMRSNDITSLGFDIVFRSLFLHENLKKIQIQWNNLGFFFKKNFQPIIFL